MITSAQLTRLIIPRFVSYSIHFSLYPLMLQERLQTYRNINIKNLKYLRTMISMIIGVQRNILIFRYLLQASVSLQNIEHEVATFPREFQLFFAWLIIIV